MSEHESMFRPHLDRMAGYVPGEQPREAGFTKLNTNENPYPPSPRVFEAIRSALDGRLRLYPDPVGNRFRRIAAELHGVDPEMILVGNGSDDILTIITRSFVGPGDVVAYPTPSYILYRTLAELQDARAVEIPFEDDWNWDPDRVAAARPRLVFLANPNSPSGTVIASDRLVALSERLDCPLVVDEAYVDFANEHAVGLVSRRPNVIVTRSLSKGYGLAGLRVGYAIAPRPIIEGLLKVKDSYNCDALSLAGGAAALEDRAYLAETRARIVATRERLTAAARSLGYRTTESSANFVWCTGRPDAVGVYERLKERKILVRLMRYPGIEPGLRITVGTDGEIDRLLEVWRSVV
ncbi:MAG: histidinol-phosphate transaminase [Isosphaeraceae bacterium]|nr:histidinol-phosphate transaminase [Isosphaeraceae bacterium]